MNAQSRNADRRLIEEWLPINELSIEAIRERSAASALPPINWLHVWWARRPLTISRAAVAASLLPDTVNSSGFYDLMGIHPGIVDEQKQIDAAKSAGLKLKQGYSRRRAFTHNPTPFEFDWLRDNLAVSDPVVVDITAGGGSIPFETGRLGLRSIANELNPVAGLILRATCQWPQRYGYTLLNAYDSLSDRFKRRVRDRFKGIYPREIRLSDENGHHNTSTSSARRYVWAYLWARVARCPACDGQIPLSPNWKLSSDGHGIRLLPDVNAGTCNFEVVETVDHHSRGTVNNGIATCPYPNCGATTPRGYISSLAQAGNLGHQLYCVIYRDLWWPLTKTGKPRKRPKSRRGFRAATPEDDNSALVSKMIGEIKSNWEAEDVLPTESVPIGNKTKEPLRYGMSSWCDMFSPRQQLAHGHCVQAFKELVDADRSEGRMDEIVEAAWCYISLAFDKVIARNSLICRWDAGQNKVASTFDSHDFGMKWSYAELAVTIEGIGLDWALDEIRDCIEALVKLAGYPAVANESSQLSNHETTHLSYPTMDVTADSAELLLTLDSKSVDAIVFDPPYYDNVSYAELSDFYYVWIKRTAGYVLPECFSAYLTDKENEAIASQARFKPNERRGRGGGSIKTLAYEDYVERMRRIFDECRRIIKDDGIMTIMFTHKTTDAWDALTIGIIEAGFRITASWPVKTESDSSLNIRDRAAARSTILLACRPKTANSAGSTSWEQVELEIATKVRERIPQLESYDLRPLDVYLAAFGPALEVISNNWPIHRELANPGRPYDPFIVTPNDALQVARKEVFDARRRHVSELWANNPGDQLTEFYILSQDSAGSATIPFDEANMVARCIGLELADDAAKQIYQKKGSNINLLTGTQRFEEGKISPTVPSTRGIDRVHTAVALGGKNDVNAAIEWCRMQGFHDDINFKGTLEALLRVMRPDDPDLRPAQTLWSEMYREETPELEALQLGLLDREG